MHFVLPLDRYHRKIAHKILAEEGAPFSISDRVVFRQKVKNLWIRYQNALYTAKPSHLLRPFHRLDRILFSRNREEYIDDPNFPIESRVQTIQKLDQLNQKLGSYQWVFSALESLLHKIGKPTIKLLDIGSGHGGFPIRLAQKGQLGGYQLQVTGSDISPDYISHARQNAMGVSVDFQILDARHLSEVSTRFDIITCMQTLHHFSPEFVAEFLYSARENVKHGVLIFDARRAFSVLFAASVANIALTRNRFLLHDGWVSIRRMYSVAELELLACASPGGKAYTAHYLGPAYTVASCVWA